MNGAVRSCPLLKFKSEVIFTRMLSRLGGCGRHSAVRWSHFRLCSWGIKGTCYPTTQLQRDAPNQFHSRGQMSVAAAEVRRTSAPCLDKVVTWLLKERLSNLNERGFLLISQANWP